MNSTDEQSGITAYFYEPGRFNGTDWESLGDEFLVSVEENKVSALEAVTIPEALESLDVVFYRATAINAAGDESSLPGYSAGAKLYEGVPLIKNLIGETVNGGLQFIWDVEDAIPVQTITLKTGPQWNGL